MQVYDVLEQVLIGQPEIYAIYVGQSMYDQHVREQADDLLEEGVDPAAIQFYVPGPTRGVRILCDKKLKPWGISCVTLPEGV